MSLNPSVRRHTIANSIFYKTPKTDFEVYQDPVIATKHERSLSEKKTRTDVPLQINNPILTSSLPNKKKNSLKDIQERIKHVQLEIASYRLKQQFKKEVKDELELMDLKYKRLTDIDLDLTLLIDKITE